MKIALATALALVLASPAFALETPSVYAIFHADAAATTEDEAADATLAAAAADEPASAPSVAAEPQTASAVVDPETTGSITPPVVPAATGAHAFFLADAAARADADDATPGEQPAAEESAATETAAVETPAAASAPAATPASGGSVHALVTAAALRHGVDPALAHAVASVESRYRCSAVGRAGELGVMQVKPATARSVGVTGNLRDCATGIEAGMRYLKAALDRHGTGCGGISAYNMGIHRNASFCNGYGRKVMAAMGTVRLASLD